MRNSDARLWKYLSPLGDYGFREAVSVVVIYLMQRGKMKGQERRENRKEKAEKELVNLNSLIIKSVLTGKPNL
ncbi:hypothetical protein K1719_047353 [Acacia pycnantha]|nr:hypothetical protein K1719_047353 [Acacia pycnantha]